MFVLKLPRFFTRLYGKRNSAAISKLTYIWTPSSRSCIILALDTASFDSCKKCTFTVAALNRYMRRKPDFFPILNKFGIKIEFSLPLN